MLSYPSVKRSAYAPVAQLDRVTGYEPVGQGFESLPAYQIKEEIPQGISSFILHFVQDGTRKGGTSAHTGAKIANR